MKLLVIDGNSLINRAFYGIKLLTTKTGQYTNGVYGFINMLNKLMELEKPEGVAVAFDLKAPTFRHKMYDAYKAGRKGMPPELASQLPILKEWLSLMGYTVLEKEGYEADDILGTLSLSCEKSGNECVIATGDRDSLQLVSDKVRVLNTVTKMGKPEIIEYDVAKIMEKYGVEPKLLIDIKALQGDSSDNIPGVAGVGEKTADMLVANFGSIDNIYENIDSLDIKDNLKNKLIQGKESAYLSRALGTINREVPIDANPENYRTKPMQRGAVASLMAKLEFFSLIEKMGLKTEDITQTQSEKETLKLNVVPLTEILNANPSEICLIFGDDGEKAALCSETYAAVCDISDSGFIDMLENEKIAKNIYNCKSAYKLLSPLGVDIKNLCFDGMLAGYLCSPSSTDYSIERLCAEYAVRSPEFEEEPDSLLKLCADYFAVCVTLKEKCEENGFNSLLKDIELPLAEVLASMELCGFSVDAEGISKMGRRLENDINSLEREIYSLAGENFNINSPKQLGVVLFERLGLPVRKKTKSGYSTNAEVLESLLDEHPIIGKLLEYRKLTKLKSTYCDGLTAAIMPDGRIRSTLNQTETRTGRISSAEPNLQNIPVRTEAGRELRKYFTAEKGKLLIDADYSQIELRVLAHMAKDEIMIKAFREETDIHTVTASQVFNMPENMVTPLMRSRAKAVNFGIVYGIGAFSLAKDIGVTRKEAASYIESYLNTYSGVARYMDSVIERARETGFVSTMFARRRYLPELTSANAILRAAGERIARNMPIQGTAADIIKIAMIKVYLRLKKEIPEARLIMQIHDELIVEAPKEKAEAAKALLIEEMQSAAELCVPLTVDAGIGETWYDAKG